MYKKVLHQELICHDILKTLETCQPEITKLFLNTPIEAQNLLIRLHSFNKLFGIKVSYGLSRTSKSNSEEAFFYKIELNKKTELSLARKGGFAYYYISSFERAEQKAFEKAFRIIKTLLKQENKVSEKAGNRQDPSDLRIQ